MRSAPSPPLASAQQAVDHAGASPPLHATGDRDASEPPVLWAAGGFAARVVDPDGRARVVRVDRPFAVLGRAPGVDVRVRSPEASLRHAYLHRDGRGLFAVDLASRTGLRIDGAERRSGWLDVGQVLEVAGWTVEVLDADIHRDGRPAGSPIEDDAPGLVPLTIAMGDDDRTPLALGSELVFLGRGACCGLRVDDAAAARVHALIVRETSSAFVVDLVGSGLSRNGRPVEGASPLVDGDVLALGRARLHVRLGRPFTSLLRRSSATALLNGDPGPAPLPSSPSSINGSSVALVAWVLRAVQFGQGEMLRRQGELQEVIEAALRDQSALLRESIDRMARIDRELAELREELKRSTTTDPATSSLPALLPGPLRLPRLDPAEAAPGRSTGWLLDRVHQLEEENRSTWRALIGRLVPAASRAD